MPGSGVILRLKSSELAAPTLSVTVTRTLNVRTSSSPGVPENVWEEGLKASHAGNGEPLDKVAWYDNMSPASSSLKAVFGTAKVNGTRSVVVTSASDCASAGASFTLATFNANSSAA